MAWSKFQAVVATVPAVLIKDKAAVKVQQEFRRNESNWYPSRKMIALKTR